MLAEADAMAVLLPIASGVLGEGNQAVHATAMIVDGGILGSIALIDDTFSTERNARQKEELSFLLDDVDDGGGCVKSEGEGEESHLGLIPRLTSSLALLRR
jgi:hypothetical protein